MANQTTEFKRTVSGTINSGMRSVFGGEGRRYFIIEHKDDSALHRRGEQQKMIVDEVFIGRDKKCQVLIDEQFGTVSREHAVIVRDGDRWKLIHRSSTNDTFVNGQRVMGEQYLQNGDEIQLSYNGPRLGFIIPQGDQSFVKSIGMTARLNLFRQQALRPYKTALTLLTILFCLAVAGLVTGLVLTGNKAKGLEREIVEVNDSLDAVKGRLDLFRRHRTDGGGGHTRLVRVREGNDKGGGGGDVPSDLAAFEPYVYLVKMTNFTIDAPKNSPVWDETDFLDFIGRYYDITLPFTYTFVGDDVPLASGFITNNGYLVTARHVVEPWVNGLDDWWVFNYLIELGAVFDAEIVAESSSGDHKVFKYSDFSVDRSKDVKKKVEKEIDVNGPKKFYATIISSVRDDYAYKKTNTRSNIVMNPSLSRSLPAGVRLDVLGFPYGLGTDKNSLKPQYSFATTTNSGLLHGTIPVSGATFEEGNSGGPVFYKEGGKYYVVGLVSSSYGRSGGQVLPISALPF